MVCDSRGAVIPVNARKVTYVVYQVSVCGPRSCTDQDARDAFRVGQLLAEAGATVICGGGSGVMAAVAAGVRSNGGTVIGIRPTGTREAASPDLSAVVVTNMGEARNAVIVWSADAVISVGGSWGTLSEIALGMRRGGIPVICLNGWRVIGPAGADVEGLQHVTTAEHAVALALSDRPRDDATPTP